MSGTARRALVVDDSRSARVILSRLLEIYGVQVDSVESGEQALEYLVTTQPDVIFMDHLMPGMDGFEAVRALKSNPRTRAIPVMMYSSQEGPEYLHAALTSGAEGVLPKTLTQTDVSRALYQLRMLPDRRDAPPIDRRDAASASTAAQYSMDRDASQRASQHMPGAATANQRRDSDTASALNITSPEARAAGASMLKTHDADLRHALHAEFEVLTQRLLESQRRADSSNASPAASELQSTPWVASAATAPRRGMWTALSTLVLVVMGLSWYSYAQYRAQGPLLETNGQLNKSLIAQQQQIDALRAELLQHNANVATERWSVPYGEVPFAAARITAIRDRLLELQTLGFKGAVQLDSYTGDFCLSGSAVTGFTPARADLSIRRCDVIGNPVDDAITDETQQSAAFAAMLAMVTRNGTLAPQVKLVRNGHIPATAYPDQTGAQAANITAGDWNAIAASNNRVEITLLQQTTL